MEIVIEELFVVQLLKCPVSFQQKFRRCYQQFKVVDKPTEVKNVTVSNANKDFYKLYIDESRIGLLYKNKKLHILCFLYNQYFE